MWARFYPKWQNLVREHDGASVVLVGHNGLIRMLICYLIGAPFENFKRVHIANCGISRVEIEGERGLVRSINETHFLKTI
jgi:broad specificity phosphatase PhoE